MTPRRALLAAPALLLAPAAARAQAEPWPSRPVRIIVPYGAGGGTDLTARAVMEAASGRLGRPVVVENRGGAEGAIGSEAVARATDNHTLLAQNPTHLILRHTAANLPYDPIADFQPVAIFARYAFVLLASVDAPFRDVPGMLAAARARPGTIGHGTPDAASAVVGAQMCRAAGIELNDIRYPGGGPAMRDLMGGHLPLAWVSTATAMPLRSSDRVRIIAVTSPATNSLLPEIPTLASFGLGAASYEGWFGMLAPARLPREAALRLNAEANAALLTEPVRDRLRTLAVEPQALDLAATDAAIREDAARWAAAEREGLLRRGA
ncbi:MAG: tripartite tricarboxylate transporter substrate binding protein [Acetobacteraceae bacterium]|nr:tripartite tricarboxylate transporter substrate binding protein [Acetobacteraceae bacterium]